MNSEDQPARGRGANAGPSRAPTALKGMGPPSVSRYGLLLNLR
jgi:hypothetical protein